MNRHQGFTLVEVLIALSLFGLMLGMIFTVLTMASRTWEAAEPRAAALDSRLVLERFLRRHLAAALIWPDSRNRPSFVGDSRQLTFVAFPPLVIDMKGPQRFQLVKERDRLRVRIMTIDGEMPDEERKMRDVVLLERVKKVRFRYFAGEEWRDDWTEHKLPDLVEMTVEIRDGFPWPPIVIGLRNSVASGRGSGVPRKGMKGL